MSLLRTEFAEKLAASGDLGSLGMKPHAVFICELTLFFVVLLAPRTAAEFSMRQHAAKYAQKMQTLNHNSLGL